MKEPAKKRIRLNTEGAICAGIIFIALATILGVNKIIWVWVDRAIEGIKYAGNLIGTVCIIGVVFIVAQIVFDIWIFVNRGKK